jgi:hypothetical protein
MIQVFNNKLIQKASILSVLLITFSFFNCSVSYAQWAALGSAGFSTGTANYQTIAYAPDGTPYVAYQDGANSNRTTVMKYNGTAWVVVGTAGFSSGSADLQKIAIDASNTPYVAYRQASLLIVQKFDGTNWVAVGSSLGFVGDALDMAVANDQTVYVGYADIANSATVQKFDGTNWVTVGSASFSVGTAEYHSLAISPNNEPYLAYRDGGLSSKIMVKRFNGSAWVDAGTGNVSNDFARHPDLAFDRAGVPYVAFHNGGIMVKKLVNDVWTSVGFMTPSEDNYTRVQLTFDLLDTPCVAYLFGSNFHIKQYYAGFWFDLFLGQPSFGSYQNMITGRDGHLYVALRDGAQSNKTSVYKYTAPALIDVVYNGVSTTLGTVNLGAGVSFTKTFTIYNRGNVDLTLSGTPIVSVSSGTAFTVSRQPSATVINGQTSLSFDVQYQSSGVGNTDTGQLTISSNSAVNSSFTINLTANGLNESIDESRGNMLVLDGTDDYVEVPTSTSLNNYATSDELTIEYWVRPLSADASKVLFAKRNAGNTGGFVVETAASNVVNHQVYFDGAGWQSLSTTYTANQWQHIAITYKSGDGFKLYKDGVLVANNALSDNLSAVSAVLRLGKDSEFSNAGNWQGKIDEWRMWSVARTQSQIREGMFLTLTGQETGLDVYYQFNHNTGNVIDKINGNDGTVHNGVSRETSEVSVAGGVASRKVINTTGRVMFGDVNVAIEFTAVSAPSANDEFVVYQLYEAPYNNVSGVVNTTDCYWVIKRFGSQTFEIDQLTFSLPKAATISTIDENNPANFKLYKRNEASMDADWGGSVFADGQWASQYYKQISFGSLAVPANALNMTSLSEFVISGTATSGLPVDLLSFTAKRASTHQVVLQWVTASEHNNAGFAIETSPNGRVYTQVGFVKGKGNSGQKQHYQWKTSQTKAAYYRLKQLDTDGKYSHSLVRFVEGIATPLRLVTYPNPVVQGVQLQLANDEAPLLLKVYNSQAKRMLLVKGTLSEVQQALNKQLVQWQNGTYLLVIWQNNQQLSRRILLQR